MNVQSAIPAWLQWAWALAGLGIAGGGLVWILGIFWPYLRWSKRMMLQSYELGHRTAEAIGRIQDRIEPIIEKADKVLVDLRALVGDVRTRREPERAVAALERLVKWLEIPVDGRAAGGGADEAVDPREETRPIAYAPAAIESRVAEHRARRSAKGGGDGSR